MTTLSPSSYNKLLADETAGLRERLHKLKHERDNCPVYMSELYDAVMLLDIEQTHDKCTMSLPNNHPLRKEPILVRLERQLKSIKNCF